MDYTQYVLPFMGSTSGGNDFPGVSRPFGMVKIGPDNIDGTLNAYSGYLPHGAHTGFSMMHLSGTAGAPAYGVISQLPVIGDVVPSVPRHGEDTAQVGYYKSHTAQGVTVELGASEHAALYQYTFPQGGGSVVMDLSHRLPSFRGQRLEQGFAAGNISVGGGKYEGSGTYNGGYNRAPDWTVYFCGYFDPAPRNIEIFSGIGTVEGNSAHTDGERVGATFSFVDEEVTSRVGISFISSQQACQSVQKEIPASKTLSSLVNETKSIWNEQVLSKVTSTEKNITNLQLLYSSLYHIHLTPSNRTGENPLWQSKVPYYDDIFTLWDLYRTWTPLLHILQPTTYTELLLSLIDIWRHEGYLPTARFANCNGPVQGGTFADQILADAYIKGVQGINWTDAYAAMLTNAEVTPPNNHDPRAPDSSTRDGRGGLPDWKEKGFITSQFSRAVSRAVDYSGNDWGLYQVATGLGHADAEKYLNRSRNWRNHWNPMVESLGFNGFVMPRDGHGFVEYDPAGCCGYWKDPYYEASAWEYSFGALHDVPHLIELCGGSEAFVQRLGMLFTERPVHGKRGMIYDPGNEVSFASPYLFNFVGRQDLSVTTSRRIARSRFAPTTDGLPGNGDSGAMQSWLLWSMIGLYPLTGQTTFLIHSPWFEHLSIDLGGKKKLIINSTGGDQDSGIYVHTLRVNAQNWKKNYLDWNDVFAEGGTMEFQLGSTPNNDWFSGKEVKRASSQGTTKRALMPVSCIALESGPKPGSYNAETIDEIQLRGSWGDGNIFEDIDIHLID